MKRYFTLKHWLITSAIGPLLMLLYSIFTEGLSGYINELAIYPFLIGWSLMITLPMYLICHIISIAIQTVNSQFYMISIINLTLIVGIFITLYIWFEKFNPPFFIAYSLTIFLTSVLITKRKAKS